ncbi:hypothetical protein Trydic_g23072, partial [Trypoxylus dichotomus]
MPVNKDDVTYYIWNPSIGKKGHNLRRIESNHEKINPHLPVKVLIHGWMDDYNSYWYEPTVNEYLQKGCVNVITVSWGKHAKNLFYPSSVKAVRQVGQHVGDMIMEISSKYGIAIENFHLIGHSLGAHISGFAGKTIINCKNVKVGRITGLDPAWPSFENATPENRLCSNDAHFVDVIHTDAGSAGYALSIGHIDFYPNGGTRKQNGCSSLDLACSHKRAPIYFYESINSYEFVTIEAPSFVEFDCGRCNHNRRAVMGENVDPFYRNKYNLSEIIFNTQLKKNIIRMATATLIELAKKKPVDYNMANALKSEIKFQLFTSKFCNGIYLTEKNVQEANINSNLPTKFFIHGWNSNLQGNWYNAFKDEYFIKGEHNIIYVDWFIPGSKEYQVSAANVKPVGHYIADFIIASKLKLSEIHLIGKSLGAHVASWSGKQVYELTGNKVSRITALDPASPKFENTSLPETHRLNKTDAEFVDVIHTDVDYYGFKGAIGTADFYPNGGGLQPGCNSDDAGHNDSHGRSNWYFLESINSTDIEAIKANSWEDFLKGNFVKNESVVFGENISTSTIRLQMSELIELIKKIPLDYNLANALKSDIKFQFFTKDTSNGIYVTEKNIKEANIKGDVPTKIFIHGWNANMSVSWYSRYRDEYFQRGDYNIIYVDWAIPGSKEYPISAANVRPVGNFVADFIVACGINLKTTHIFGKALGAHVASWTGKHIQKLTGSKLKRITAFDADSTQFENDNVPETNRLNKTDAEFVDALHTDAGYYGFSGCLGTVDFFPNGGGIQPGCNYNEDGHHESHERAQWYFMEAINSSNVKAVKSRSWEEFLNGNVSEEDSIVFGEDTPMSAQGVYYFETSGESPFTIDSVTEQVNPELVYDMLEASWRPDLAVCLGSPTFCDVHTRIGESHHINTRGKDIQKWVTVTFVLIIHFSNVNSFLSEKIVHIYNIPPVDYSKADALETDVTYQLFTNKNTSGLYMTKESVANILDIDIPTKFVIHGWLSNETTYWYGPYRDECFKKEFYVSAANSKPVGGYIADFIISAKLKVDNVHIIGHSLGSQVAGFIGKRIYERTGSKIARITCTDPAGPSFEHSEISESNRVTNTDAEFVDVVHTDIGHYGFIKAIGHVDFYPNGGTLQPGCPSYEEDDNCSHARSNLYFIESVNSEKFLATPCVCYENYSCGEADTKEKIVF